MDNVWTAASDGDLGQVRQYVASGSDINAMDEHGYTPLQAAVSYNHIQLVLFLLQHGASPTLSDYDMDTPLHRCESTECAQILLESGAQLNARNHLGQTPLDVAIEEELEGLVKYYKSIGAESSDMQDVHEGE